MPISKYASQLIRQVRTIDQNDPEAVKALQEYNKNPNGRMPEWFTKQGPGIWKVAPKKFVQIHSDNDPYMKYRRYMLAQHAILDKY